MDELINMAEQPPAVFQAMPEGAARLNVTWGGQNGDLPDPIPYDANEDDIKQMAAEAVRTGNIPGIGADANVQLGDFVVDRFNATDEIPYARVFIRPKTPFGDPPLVSPERHAEIMANFARNRVEGDDELSDDELGWGE